MKVSLASFLKLLIIFLGLIYLFLLIYVLTSKGYMPYHEDETINYNAGRSFFETNSLKAPSCLYENVSPLLGSNWYGFFYNVFYGVIGKVFGYSSKLFIIINVILLISGLYILTKIGIGKDNRRYFAIILLLIPNVIYFLFGYWPVIINVSLTISLIYLLFKINLMAQEKVNFSRIRNLYLFLCFMYIIVNPLWAIWVIGILPFNNNIKNLTKSVFTCLGIILISFVYIKLFCAPWIAGNTSIMFYYLFNFEILHFLHLIKQNFIENIYYFYDQNLLFLKASKYDNVINQFLSIILLFFSPIYFFYKKNKLYFSISLITFSITFILITIYTSEFEYFQRVLTPVYVLLLFGLFSTDLKVLKTIVLILLLISFPFSVLNSFGNINLRKQMYFESTGKYKSLIQDLGQIKYYVDPNESTIIQWVYFEYDLPRAMFSSYLPLSDTRNNPIIYTTKINCFIPSECDDISDEKKFETFNRLGVNYALSKNEIVLKGYRLIYHCKNFKLYRINKIEKKK